MSNPGTATRATLLTITTLPLPPSPSPSLSLPPLSQSSQMIFFKVTHRKLFLGVGLHPSTATCPAVLAQAVAISV